MNLSAVGGEFCTPPRGGSCPLKNRALPQAGRNLLKPITPKTRKRKENKKRKKKRRELERGKKEEREKERETEKER